MSDYGNLKENKWCELRFGQPEHGSGHFPIDLCVNGGESRRNQAAGQ